MKIPCISCQSIFHFDSIHIQPTGTLVKCSKYDFIFMVHPSDLEAQPITQDTNIDQSVLFDLFKMQHLRKSKVTIDEIPDELDDYEVESLISIEDLGEEVADIDYEEGVGYADLPDLSEHEDMIDLGEDKDLAEPSASG